MEAKIEKLAQELQKETLKQKIGLRHRMYIMLHEQYTLYIRDKLQP